MVVVAHIGIGSKERALADTLKKLDKYISLSIALNDDAHERRISVFSYLLSLDNKTLSLVSKSTIDEFAKTLSYEPNENACNELIEIAMQYIFTQTYKDNNTDTTSLNNNKNLFSRLCHQSSTRFLKNALVSDVRLKVNHISCIFSHTIKGCSIASDPFEQYGIEKMQDYLYECFKKHTVTLNSSKTAG